MKITINQLRRIIKEEIETISEMGKVDIHGVPVDSPKFKEKIANKHVVSIPPDEKASPKVAEKPVGKKRVELDLKDEDQVKELVKGLNQEDAEKLLKLLGISK